MRRPKASPLTSPANITNEEPHDVCSTSHTRPRVVSNTSVAEHPDDRHEMSAGLSRLLADTSPVSQDAELPLPRHRIESPTHRNTHPPVRRSLTGIHGRLGAAPRAETRGTGSCRPVLSRSTRRHTSSSNPSECLSAQTVGQLVVGELKELQGGVPARSGVVRTGPYVTCATTSG